jgi:predicted RNase H-like HicB family nuclease
VPDLPGCVSTGQTAEEVELNVHEAIEGHLHVMKEVGEPIPEPSTAVTYFDAPMPA